MIGDVWPKKKKRRKKQVWTDGFTQPVWVYYFCLVVAVATMWFVYVVLQELLFMCMQCCKQYYRTFFPSKFEVTV